MGNIVFKKGALLKPHAWDIPKGWMVKAQIHDEVILEQMPLDDLEEIAKQAAWIEFVRCMRRAIGLVRGLSRVHRCARIVAEKAFEFGVDADRAARDTVQYIREEQFRNTYRTSVRYHYPTTKT